MTYPPASGPYAAYYTTVYQQGGVNWLHVNNGIYLSGTKIGSPTGSDYSTAFNLLDTDSDGYISISEFNAYCAAGWNGVGQTLNATQRQNIFAQVDVDVDGQLDLTEFTALTSTVYNVQQ